MSGTDGRGRRDDDGDGTGSGEDTPRPPRRRTDLDDARRALRRDVDSSVYARRRHHDNRKRHALEREVWEPNAEPGEWTVPDRSGQRRMPGTPEPLGDLLAGLLEDRGWSGRVRSSALFARWTEVVGEDVARNCEPVRLVGGVLVVATASSSWATQLRYLSSNLQLAVNRALGEPLVDRVEVQVRR